jgi:putative ABC transport system substrate-binding protein
VCPAWYRINCDPIRLRRIARWRKIIAILAEAFIFIHSKLIAELTARHRLPTVYTWRQSVLAGGLMSYGPNSVEMRPSAVTYVDKILKGVKPAAKSLGLTIPPSLLLRADEVIR